MSFIIDEYIKISDKIPDFLQFRQNVVENHYRGIITLKKAEQKLKIIAKFEERLCSKQFARQHPQRRHYQHCLYTS